MNDLAAALVGHLVGDYLLQDDWMAKEKRTRSAVCALHAGLWTVAVCSFAGWYTHRFCPLVDDRLRQPVGLRVWSPGAVVDHRRRQYLARRGPVDHSALPPAHVTR